MSDSQYQNFEKIIIIMNSKAVQFYNQYKNPIALYYAGLPMLEFKTIHIYIAMFCLIFLCAIVWFHKM